jgi:hypothetical protein
MSNFLKKGKRKDLHKKVKYHEKEFFKLIGLLSDLAKELYNKNPDIDINDKELLKKEAQKITLRELDGMEVIILINNLRNLKEDEIQRTEDNNKKD